MWAAVLTWWKRPKVKWLERNKDVASLVKALHYTENALSREASSVRIDAAAALGRLGRPEAVEPLRQAVERMTAKLQDLAPKLVNDVSRAKGLAEAASKVSRTSAGDRYRAELHDTAEEAGLLGFVHLAQVDLCAQEGVAYSRALQTIVPSGPVPSITAFTDALRQIDPSKASEAESAVASRSGS